MWLASALIVGSVTLPLLIVVTFLWAVYRRGGAKDMGAAARALQVAWPRRRNDDGRGRLGRGRDRQSSGEKPSGRTNCPAGRAVARADPLGEDGL
jgi:hypothetical protein